MDSSMAGGSSAISTKNSGTISTYTNLTRRSRLNCLKLGKLKRLTMRAPALAVRINAAKSPTRPGCGNLLENQMKAATIAAAEGLGRLSKYRLSADERVLKRASRMPAAAA